MSHIARRTMIRRIAPLVAFAVCLGLLARELRRPPSVLATSADTPIKVGGGSMTFLSKYTWKPAANGWCAESKGVDLNAITGEHFFDPTASSRVPDPIINDAGTSWTIQLLGHANMETTTFTVGQNGVTMTASPRKCDGSGTGPSLTITPVKGGDLTSYRPLVVSRYHKDNHRYADPGCASDRDRCERLAQMVINGTGSPYDGQIFTCPDGECRIYIGLPESSGLRSHAQRHARTRAKR